MEKSFSMITEISVHTDTATWQPFILIFTWFLWLSEMAILCYYIIKFVNQRTLNHLTLCKFRFSNNEGLRFNFVDCEYFLESNYSDVFASVRQTWKNHLVLAIFLWRLSTFNSNRFCYSYGRFCSLCEGGNSMQALIDRKLCAFLFMFWLARLHFCYFFFLH